jgi:cob(I)alamin adenosyltransferase
VAGITDAGYNSCMSIVTKTGDQGETSLMFGRRVSKSDLRVEAYGSVDELTAALGLARAFSDDAPLRDRIFEVQKELITVMGELATAAADSERYLAGGFKPTTAKMVDRLTSEIAELEKDESLYPKDWVIPGKTRLSAALDLARTSARRAERATVGCQATDDRLNPEIVRYLNRLSDWCWIMARWAESQPSNSQGHRAV